MENDKKKKKPTSRQTKKKIGKSINTDKVERYHPN